jgi:hypothetical protein
MRNAARCAAAAAVVAALVGRPAAAQQGAERYQIAGDDVAIFNLAGTVTLERGSGAAVVVEVMRGGSDSRAIEIATGRVNGRETLRVLYPEDDIVYRSAPGRWETELRVRDDGTFGDEHGRERGRRVRISSSGSGLEAWADLRVLVPASQRFALFLAAGDVSARNLNGAIMIDTHHASVNASEVTGSLVIDTGSGAVVVSAVQGDLVVDTGSGSVDVTGVRGGSLLVDTGSGEVSVTDAGVTSLSVDTGSGSIGVSGASARDVLLDTRSGAVNLALTSNPDRIVIDTGSGRVTLTVPASFTAEVEVDTGSGTIDIDFPLQVRRWERTHVIGTIGEGGGRLEIDTGSGDVRIRRGS